jgi:hypothetical protein
MNLTTYIISTRGQRLATLTATTTSAGLDRATIHAAEVAAKQWATDNSHKVVSDIVSQGAYRAWVEPLTANQLATKRTRDEFNQRMQATA